MKECFSDEALTARYFGDASEEVAPHLKTCAMCARRYRDLRKDMELITGALRAIPPDSVIHRRRFGSRIIAGGVAAAIVIFAAGWFTRGQIPIPKAQTPTATQAFADASQPPRRHVHNPRNPEFEHGAPVPVSYLSYLRDAFTDDDSCGQEDAAFNPSCTQDSRSE